MRQLMIIEHFLWLPVVFSLNLSTKKKHPQKIGGGRKQPRKLIDLIIFIVGVFLIPSDNFLLQINALDASSPALSTKQLKNR